MILRQQDEIASVAGTFEPPNNESQQEVAAASEKYSAQITNSLNWLDRVKKNANTSKKALQHGS
jgi:hypothetical protein